MTLTLSPECVSTREGSVTINKNLSERNFTPHKFKDVRRRLTSEEERKGWPDPEIVR